MKQSEYRDPNTVARLECLPEFGGARQHVKMHREKSILKIRTIVPPVMLRADRPPGQRCASRIGDPLNNENEREDFYPPFFHSLITKIALANAGSISISTSGKNALAFGSVGGR